MTLVCCGNSDVYEPNCRYLLPQPALAFFPFSPSHVIFCTFFLFKKSFFLRCVLESNPGLLHWEHGVLATGPPGKPFVLLTLGLYSFA